MKRKGLYLDDQDAQLLTTIMAQYGCVSESQAVRLALRALVARPLFPPVELPAPGKPGPKARRKARKAPR
jgi:Arc/MetJ family transcription regulator